MDDEHDQTTGDRRQKLWSLIKDTRFAMLTTRHPNGHLHSRPMTTLNKAIDEDEALWFFISRRSDALADIAEDDEVNVAYANPDDDAYVSVSGRAKTVDDASTRRRLWSKSAEAWFPHGADDPDLALLRVRITHAHYWDAKASMLVQLVQRARAAVSGRPPLRTSEQGEVRMR